MTTRQQPWADDEGPRGRLLVLSGNPVSDALVRLAPALGAGV